jgi:hypothetical protein
MSEIFKFILKNTHFQFFAWFIGVLSGVIAIYEILKVKKENKPDEDIIIRETARGRCVDCDSIISANTKTCKKCGSENPFDSKELLKKTESLLYFDFDIASRYVKYNARIIEYIEAYVYSFIPFTLLVVLILIIANIWGNKYFNYFSLASMFFYLLFLFIAPLETLKIYTLNFNFSKCSPEQLFKLDNELSYIINSSKQKETLNEIFRQLKSKIDLIECLKNIKYDNILLITIFHIILYIVFIYFFL